MDKAPFVFQITANLREFRLAHPQQRAVDFSIGTPPTSPGIRAKQQQLLFGLSENPFTKGSIEDTFFQELAGLVYNMGIYEQAGGKTDLISNFIGDHKISGTIVSGGTRKALELWSLLKPNFEEVTEIIITGKEEEAHLANENKIVLLSTPLMERCGLALVIGPSKAIDALKSLHTGILGTPSAVQEDLFLMLSDRDFTGYLEKISTFENETSCLSDTLEFLSLIYRDSLKNLLTEGEKLRKSFAQQFLKCNFSFIDKGSFDGAENLKIICGNGGGREALYTIEKVLVGHGVTTMIVFAPHWTYENVYRKLEKVPLYSKALTEPNLDLLEIKFKELTRNGQEANTAITINTPNNPSGTVYSEIFLKKLFKLCEKYNVYVVDDACYIHILRAQEKNRKTSLQILVEMIQAKELHPNFLGKIFLALTASKGLGMAGARLGGVVFADSKFTPLIEESYHNELPNMMAFFIANKLTADVSAYQELLQEINTEIDGRIEKTTQILDKNNLSYKHPGGAFYLEVEAPFLEEHLLKKKVSGLREFALKMALEKGIAFMPMEVFGGEKYNIRLSLGGEKNSKQLQEDLEILLSHLKI